MKISPLLKWCGVSSAVVIISAACLFSCTSDNKSKIEIVSYVVRDRVVPLERTEIRSMVIVAFRILPKNQSTSGLVVQGELYCNDRLLSEDTVTHLDSSGDNLGFDIPLTHGDFDRHALYSIPEGRYRIVITLSDDRQQPIAKTTKEVMRSDIARTFSPSERKAERYLFKGADTSTRSTLHQGARNVSASGKRDYLIFQRNPLLRVYPDDLPDVSEQISEIRTEIAAAEYKSVTFSLNALRNLGRVRVQMSALKGEKGTLGAVAVQIGALTELTEVVKSKKSAKTVFYHLAPRVIEQKHLVIPENWTQTYWLTVHAGRDSEPGDYEGQITISPEFAPPQTLPIRVRVLPFELTDTTVEYGMMMDYAFYELDNPQWSESERELLRLRGEEIYRSFREHGMTMIYPHSHFFYRADDRGEPVLRSLRAGLEAYRKFNFPGPFCWYLGHLLQTAKPKHPGSILNYEEETAIRRLQYLLDRYESMARGLGIPKEKLVVQVVDEPDRELRADRERVRAGELLHKEASRMGFKTLVTRPWPDVDIICTDIHDPTAIELKRKGKQWWIYPNNALDGGNLVFTRYIFGFGAWQKGVNGVVPWTFQMSQGCNGNPFTVLDGPEVMVAYPGEKGNLLSTPVWEVIREGINDYKYIRLLEKLILSEKKRGNRMASVIEQKLGRFRESLGQEPGLEESRFGDWTPGRFEAERKQIVGWALELTGGSRDVH